MCECVKSIIVNNLRLLWLKAVAIHAKYTYSVTTHTSFFFLIPLNLLYGFWCDQPSDSASFRHLQQASRPRHHHGQTWPAKKKQRFMLSYFCHLPFFIRQMMAGCVFSTCFRIFYYVALTRTAGKKKSNSTILFFIFLVVHNEFLWICSCVGMHFATSSITPRTNSQSQKAGLASGDTNLW